MDKEKTRDSSEKHPHEKGSAAGDKGAFIAAVKTRQWDRGKSVRMLA